MNRHWTVRFYLIHTLTQNKYFAQHLHIQNHEKKPIMHHNITTHTSRGTFKIVLYSGEEKWVTKKMLRYMLCYILISRRVILNWLTLMSTLIIINKMPRVSFIRKPFIVYLNVKMAILFFFHSLSNHENCNELTIDAMTKWTPAVAHTHTNLKSFTLFSSFYASYLLHIKIKCYYMITKCKNSGSVHYTQRERVTLVTAVTSVRILTQSG